MIIEIFLNFCQIIEYPYVFVLSIVLSGVNLLQREFKGLTPEGTRDFY